MPKVFFATDLHGSEMCWRKFLNAGRFYDAEILICGGDMTGKAIVPIVQENGHFTVTLGAERQQVEEAQVPDVEAQIRRKGYYPLPMSVERLHELDADPVKRAECFQQVMLDGVDRWMGMAAEKLRGSGIRVFGPFPETSWSEGARVVSRGSAALTPARTSRANRWNVPRKNGNGPSAIRFTLKRSRSALRRANGRL